jgi:hypothetical protein
MTAKATANKGCKGAKGSGRMSKPASLITDGLDGDLATERIPSPLIATRQRAKALANLYHHVIDIG